MARFLIEEISGKPSAQSLTNSFSTSSHCPNAPLDSYSCWSLLFPTSIVLHNALPWQSLFPSPIPVTSFLSFLPSTKFSEMGPSLTCFASVSLFGSTTAQGEHGLKSNVDNSPRSDVTNIFESSESLDTARNAATFDGKIGNGREGYGITLFSWRTLAIAFKGNKGEALISFKRDVRVVQKKSGVKLQHIDAWKTAKHLLAGVLAAMVSRTAVAPLERLKLEYIIKGSKQGALGIAKTILMTEGIKGFWKGNLLNILRTAPFKSINFVAYDLFRKQILVLSKRNEVTNFEKLAAGATAGITATIICFPLDTIRTRIVAPGGEALGGVRGCLGHILHREGFSSLYAGLLPSVLSMAPAGAVFYGVYDILKSSHLSSIKPKKRGEYEVKDYDQLHLGPLRTLLYGAISGACAETVTYPFEVVRRNLQLQDASSRLGLMHTVYCMVQKDGIGALYAGLLPSVLQVLPSAALSYFVYETTKLFLDVS